MDTLLYDIRCAVSSIRWRPLAAAAVILTLGLGIGTFSTQEERQGDASGVALISDLMWRTRYGGSPSVLGRPVVLDGRPFSIIGVLPPGVRFPYEAEV